MTLTGLILIIILTAFKTEACNVPDTPLNINVVWVNNTMLDYLCKPGHLLTAGNLTRYCINNTWTGSPPDCQAITCTPPVEGDKIQLNFTTASNKTTYLSGDTVEYTCDSGHITLQGSSSGEAVCDENGQWKSNVTEMTFTCYKTPAYVGCYDKAQLGTILYEESVTNYLQCRGLCKTYQSRFSMVTNTSCICHNEKFSSDNLVNDTDCNFPCPAESFIGRTKCGGTDGAVGLFTTLGDNKCIEAANLTDAVSFRVSGIERRTCAQRCLGQLSTYAFLNLNESSCRCSPENYVNITNAKNSYCENNDDPTKTYEKLLNLAVVEPLALSCQSLYLDWKIKDSGDYLLKGNVNRTTCNFKDGTICDVGWIGFEGSCYYFNSNLQNFTNAQQYCINLDADLVSINSNDERQFVREAIKGFPEYDSVGRYFLGFTDSNEVNVFTWTDGALHTVSYFKASEASTDDGSRFCSVINHDGTYETRTCEETQGFVCEKAKGYCRQSNDLSVFFFFQILLFHF